MIMFIPVSAAGYIDVLGESQHVGQLLYHFAYVHFRYSPQSREHHERLFPGHLVDQSGKLRAVPDVALKLTR